jgi:Ca-activated chloride channel family protein
MKSRSQNLPNSAFGLVAWLEKTRVALPLKGVECRFSVTGAIACVEIDQIYHQNSARPLDCTYTFPLPAGAAVYRCELHVNGRVIRAKVEEKEKAQQIFREQKAAGRRAALVETERENLFTLSLGNVQPGDLIIVRFAWFQVLDRIAGGLRLMVPTCPGVRYIPGKPLLRGSLGGGTADDTDQVPDASRISPPRIDALHPDAAYFSIDGRLSSTDVEIGTITSPSHPVITREIEGQMRVSIFGQDAVPDRDFVLVWHEPKAKELVSQTWRWTEADTTYALVQLRAPEVVNASDNFSQDFYFLVDRSGSMEGAKWRRTCEALRAFVGLLGAKDRVAITLFESDFRDFAEAPMPAPKVCADKGFQRMESLGTQGGTELLPAMRHVLEQVESHSQGRRTSAVLITDGQVGNESAIIMAFKNSPSLTVHTFGIDTAVNDAFLRSLADQQRGGCWLQTPDDDIAGTIAALGDRLRRPVLTDLSIRGAWDNGKASLPDLHAREVVTIALRGNAATPLEITGLLPNGQEHCFALPLDGIGSEAIKLLWAKERIAALLSSERLPEAIACAKQHNLICEGTAFIAWDEAEQVSIALDEIIQPAIEASMGSVCYSMVSPSMSVQRCTVSERGSLGHVPAPILHRPNTASPDIVSKRIAKLREILQEAGVSQTRAEDFVTWVRDDDTLQRINTLEQATCNLSELKRELGRWMNEGQLDLFLTRAIESLPDAFVEWVEQMRNALQRIHHLRQLLGEAGTPVTVLDHLCVWIFEPGTLNRDRLEKLAAFAKSLERLPFSAASKARHWRAFLDTTSDSTRSLVAAERSWFAELESS